MAISRLRLRLVASFGAALLASLVVLSGTLFIYLRGEAEEVLTDSLTRAANGLDESVRRWQQARPAAGLDELARLAVDAWPIDDEIVAVADGQGRLIAARAPAIAHEHPLPVPLEPGKTKLVTRQLSGGDRARIAVRRSSGALVYAVAAGRSTKGLRSDAKELIAWLVVAVPLASLLAALGGYVLASRALAPIRFVAEAADGIDAETLDTRLPVGSPPDELDQLAFRFNSLLDRLAAARQQVRRFLADAAHQIKTPLTIVAGESALALERERDPDEYRLALERIRRAAGQMARRVDELFLLARAEAGERPAVDDVVELDSLALDVTDLLRGRASRMRKRLELDRVAAVETRGNEALLREALTELIENALKYSDAAEPVRVSAGLTAGDAFFEVSSRGASPLAEPEGRPADASPGGLGLPIVRWIAAAHRGRLDHEVERGTIVYRLVWPDGTSSPDPQPSA